MRPHARTATLSGAFVFALSLLDTSGLLSTDRLFSGGVARARARRVLRRAPRCVKMRRGFIADGDRHCRRIDRDRPPVRASAAQRAGQSARGTRDGRACGMFLVVVIVAGGVREELQRAFLLQPIPRRSRSAVAGCCHHSIAFGMGHTLQGLDAA
jgi:hypothetical protein